MISEGSVIIVGGGRWARVIAGVLDGLLPAQVSLRMHSPSNHQNLRMWVSQRKLERVQVFSEAPCYSSIPKSLATVVANRSRHHFTSAQASLVAGVPVLVEKPAVLTLKDASTLLVQSRDSGTPIYAARVFSFASYLKLFCQKVRQKSPPDSVSLTWCDPSSEVRLGEKKTFDPTISVIQDVFPHVYSVLRHLSSEKLDFSQATISRGGKKVVFKLTMGALPVNIELERNGKARRRVFNVQSGQENLSLDFTKEPGLISCGSDTAVVDLEWHQNLSPLSLLLTSFLDAILKGAKAHSALSFEECLDISSLSEKITETCHMELTHQLTDIEKRSPEDHAYALAELRAYGRKPLN